MSIMTASTLADHNYVRIGRRGVSIECGTCGRHPDEHPDAAEALDLIHHEQDVQLWFSLSYAQYLTIPRSVLQEMPAEWQQRFTRCLRELDSEFDWRPNGQYWVELRDAEGRYKNDPLKEYRHPDYAYIERLHRPSSDR